VVFKSRGQKDIVVFAGVICYTDII